MLINSIPRFRVTFRVIYYLPVITSWVIVSLVFRYIFNTEGMLNYLLTKRPASDGVPTSAGSIRAGAA